VCAQRSAANVTARLVGAIARARAQRLLSLPSRPAQAFCARGNRAGRPRPLPLGGARRDAPFPQGSFRDTVLRSLGSEGGYGGYVEHIGAAVARIPKENGMDRIFLALAAIVLASVLTACNTMSGLGQDIQRGGENLEEEAEKHK